MGRVKRTYERIRDRGNVLRLTLSQARHRPTISFDVPPATAVDKTDLQIFTAADSVYLQRYLRSFLGSCKASIPESRVHVHLYEPDERDFAFIQRAAEEYSDSIALSWSHQDLAHGFTSNASPKQSWKSLYICCSRFLAAQSVRSITGAPMLAVDIDILFKGDVHQRFRDVSGCAMMLRPGEYKLAKRSLGGVVFVSASTIGQQFLLRTCDYIERFLAAEFYWFAFDQYALHRALQTMPASDRAEGFSPLTEQDISFELSGNALILFPKGPRKEGVEFTRLADAFGKRA